MSSSLRSNSASPFSQNRTAFSMQAMITEASSLGIRDFDTCFEYADFINKRIAIPGGGGTPISPAVMRASSRSPATLRPSPSSSKRRQASFTSPSAEDRWTGLGSSAIRDIGYYDLSGKESVTFSDGSSLDFDKGGGSFSGVSGNRSPTERVVKSTTVGSGNGFGSIGKNDAKDYWKRRLGDKYAFN